MKILAIFIFVFFSLLGVAIYFTKNYQYEKYILTENDTNQKLYKINVNLASWHDYASLPGISDSLAKHIVEHREKNGRFDQIEDLLKVKGIGKKKFAAIQEFLTMDV